MTHQHTNKVNARTKYPPLRFHMNASRIRWCSTSNSKRIGTRISSRFASSESTFPGLVARSAGVSNSLNRDTHNLNPSRLPLFLLSRRRCPGYVTPNLVLRFFPSETSHHISLFSARDSRSSSAARSFMLR